MESGLSLAPITAMLFGLKNCSMAMVSRVIEGWAGGPAGQLLTYPLCLELTSSLHGCGRGRGAPAASRGPGGGDHHPCPLPTARPQTQPQNARKICRDERMCYNQPVPVPMPAGRHPDRGEPGAN